MKVRLVVEQSAGRIEQPVTERSIVERVEALAPFMELDANWFCLPAIERNHS